MSRVIVKVDANTSSAESKIKALKNKIKGTEKLRIDVDISAALSAAQRLESALGSRQEIRVGADVSAARRAINDVANTGKTADVKVTADVSAARRAVNDVANTAKAVDIKVTADASAARNVINDISSGARDVRLTVTADASDANRAIQSVTSTDKNAVIKVTANTTGVKSDIDSLTADRNVTIDVAANVSAAQQAINDVEASAGDIKVTAKADVSAVQAALNRLEANQDTLVDVDADISKATSKIDSLNGRSVTVDVNTSGGAASVGSRVIGAANNAGGRGVGLGGAVVGGAVGGVLGAAGIETTEEIIRGGVSVIADTLTSGLDFESASLRALSRANVPLETADGAQTRIEFEGLIQQLGNDTSLVVNPLEAIEASIALTTQGISLQNQLTGDLRTAIQLQNANPDAGFGLAGQTLARFINLNNIAGGDLDSNQIADRLTGATLSSQFRLNDLNLLASQGGIATARGFSVDDFLRLGVFNAGAGAGGSDVGTAIKTLTSVLDKQTGPAQEALAELGILTTVPSRGQSFLQDEFGLEVGATSTEVFEGFREAAKIALQSQELDLESAKGLEAVETQAAIFAEQSGVFQNRFFQGGEFVGESEFTKILQESTAGLSSQERTNLFSPIFGSDSGRIAEFVTNQDPARRAEQEATLFGTSAGDIAQRQNQTARGQLDALEDSVSTAQTQVSSEFLGPLQTFFGDISAFVQDVTPLASEAGAGLSESVTPFLEDTSAFLSRVGEIATDTGSLSEGLSGAIDDTFPLTGQFIDELGQTVTAAQAVFGQAGEGEPVDAGVFDATIATFDGIQGVLKSVAEFQNTESSLGDIGGIEANLDLASGILSSLGELSQIEVVDGGVADQIIEFVSSISDVGPALSSAIGGIGLGLAEALGSLLDPLGATNPLQNLIDDDAEIQAAAAAEAGRARQGLTDIGLNPDSPFQLLQGQGAQEFATAVNQAVSAGLTQDFGPQLPTASPLDFVGPRTQAQATGTIEPTDLAVNNLTVTGGLNSDAVGSGFVQSPDFGFDPLAGISVPSLDTGLPSLSTAPLSAPVPVSAPVVPELNTESLSTLSTLDAVSVPFEPIIAPLEPQEGIANMSIGDVEPIPDQEAAANISWIIPPIPTQSVTVRVNYDSGGDTGANSTQDGGGAADGPEFRASGIQRTRRGRNYVVSEMAPELLELPSGQRLLALERGEIRPPAGTRIYSGTQTRQELGVRDTTAATEAFADGIKDLGEDISRGSDERQISTAISNVVRAVTVINRANSTLDNLFNQSATAINAPVSFGGGQGNNFGGPTFSFAIGGQYTAGQRAIMGELGPEMVVDSTGRVGFVGSRGPAMLKMATDAEVFNAAATERIQRAMGTVRSDKPSVHSSTINNMNASRNDNRTFNVSVAGNADRQGARQFVSNIRHLEASL